MTTYRQFNEDYQKHKSDLAIIGVRSLSGYISYLLEEQMQENETLATHTPAMKKISNDDERVVLLDSTINRITEIVVRDGELSCRLCESNDCMHVGFAYALPAAHIILNTHRS